jgi:hypothetical protein
MVRSVIVAGSVLLWGLSLPARAGGGEWGGGELLSGAVGLGTYYGLVYEASAEVVVADRVAIGAKAVYLPGWEGEGELGVLPSVSLGTPRSLPSAAYFILACTPGSSSGSFGGTLGLGYERTLPNRMRVFGEAGVVAAAGKEGGGALPYLLVGVRWRF